MTYPTPAPAGSLLKKPRRILNFGVGTQSSVVYFLMERGIIEPAEVAVFSDLGWEPAAVYEHLDWMQSVGTIPIVVIKSGNIRADALVSQVRGKAADGTRWASMPLYVRKVWELAEADLFASVYLEKPTDIQDEWSLFGFSTDPASLQNMLDHQDLKRGRTVERRGMIRRQCTSEYKIAPIRKWIKKNILGLESGQRWPTSHAVTQVFGISHDERQRMRDSLEPWSVFDYPLVKMGWNRERVIAYAQEHFPGRIFPRSACIGCPFHSNEEWREMRDNRPLEWADAVEFDKAIRKCGGMRGEMFLHRDCVPLDEVNLDGAMRDGVSENECFGMCGV